MLIYKYDSNMNVILFIKLSASLKLEMTRNVKKIYYRMFMFPSND